MVRKTFWGHIPLNMQSNDDDYSKALSVLFGWYCAKYVDCCWKEFGGWRFFVRLYLNSVRVFFSSSSESQSFVESFRSHIYIYWFSIDSSHIVILIFSRARSSWGRNARSPTFLAPKNIRLFRIRHDFFFASFSPIIFAVDFDCVIADSHTFYYSQDTDLTCVLARCNQNKTCNSLASYFQSDQPHEFEGIVFFFGVSIVRRLWIQKAYELKSTSRLFIKLLYLWICKFFFRFFFFFDWYMTTWFFFFVYNIIYFSIPSGEWLKTSKIRIAIRNVWSNQFSKPFKRIRCVYSTYNRQFLPPTQNRIE